MPSLSQKFAASSSSSPVPPSTLQKRPNIPAFLIPTVTVTSLLCIASFLKSFAPLTNIVIVTASCSAALYAFHHQKVSRFKIGEVRVHKINSCPCFYKRRARIRQIYFTTLHLVRQLVALCGHNDARLAVLLDKLHWLDLISQGYTLAPAPAYITLSEPSRRSMEIRRLLAHEFRTQSQKYSTFTDCMDALSHQDNLIRFRTLYNVEKVPTYAADFESVKVSIEKLENMATIVHWKRRECVIHLLALDVMTADHDSTRSDYEQQWDSAIRIMRELVSECQRFAELLDRQLEHGMYHVCLWQKRACNLTIHVVCAELVPEYNDGGTEHPDQRTQALVRRYTALEKQMQQIRGKMLLCRQDTVLINPNPGSVASSNYAFDRISERFSSIEQDLSHLTMQWDEIKSTFESLRQQDNDEQEHTNAALSNNTMLPSPPLSPKKVKEQNMRLATLESRRAVVRKAAAVAYFLENRRTQKQRNHQQVRANSILEKCIVLSVAYLLFLYT